MNKTLPTTDEILKDWPADKRGMTWQERARNCKQHEFMRHPTNGKSYCMRCHLRPDEIAEASAETIPEREPVIQGTR